MINNIIGPTEIWLVIGIACLMAEFVLISNTGFLFLGLGALSNSVFTYLYPMAFENQIIALGLSTLCWLVVLWWPLKKYMYNRIRTQSRVYSDMIGKQVEVYSIGDSSTNIMQVKWSGTVMNALLDEQSGAVRVEDTVFVKEVQGNILICTKGHNPSQDGNH